MTAVERILLVALITVGTLVPTLVATGIVLVLLPPDHFVKPRPPWRRAWQGSPLRILGVAAKNLGGLALVVAGLALSVPGVPGQGFLTILLGLLLLDFPGKARLQRLILRPRRIRRVVNALRRRFRRPPLEFP